METTGLVLDNLVQELKRGTLVLSVLLCTDERAYGYALVSRLQEKGVDIEQNTLYPLLRRLEKQGLLDSAWDTSDSRPRRYYIISEEGTRIRSSLVAVWNDMNRAITGMEEKK